MTTKEYLEQLRQRDVIIRQKQELLEELEAKKTDVSAVCYTNAKSRTNSVTDKVGDTVARIDQIKRQIQKEIDNWLNLFEKITKQIDAIQDPSQREILTLRYVNKMEWKKIEEITYFCSRHLYRMHDKALLEFERIAKSDAWGEFME